MKNRKEKIINFPNFITLWRVPLTLISIYYLLFSGDRFIAALFLAFAGITDFLDGQVARRFDQVTEFGAKFDLAADRTFIILFAIALLIFFRGSSTELLFLTLCLSREIISLPAFIVRRINLIPYFTKAKLIGKVQTTFQAFAIVLLTWGVSWSVYFVILATLTGLLASISYWKGSFN